VDLQRLGNARFAERALHGFPSHAGCRLRGHVFIPTVIVPALLVTHFLVFRELLKKRPEPEQA